MYSEKTTRRFYSSLFTMVIPLLAVILITGCQPRESNRGGMEKGTDIDTTAILAAMDSLRSSYQEAVNTGNFENLATLVTKDAKMVQPGAADWDAMRQTAEGPFPNGTTIDIKPMETHVMSNDWVYELGSSTITYTPEGADQPTTLRDTYLVILKRTADGWKVHREVASAMLLEPKQSE